MKCKDCIFAKDMELESLECRNPHCRHYGHIIFAKCFCMKGKKTSKGLDFEQMMELERKELYGWEYQKSVRKRSNLHYLF